MTLHTAIQRELNRVCTRDVLGMFETNARPQPRTGTRQSWSRMQNLLAVLRSGDRFNAVTLARATGMCTKTIHRDLGYLKRHGVRIAYDCASNKYSVEPPIPPLFDLGAMGLTES
jgi:hypothetical protein